MYRKFSGKRYKAHQEYTTKAEAKKGQAKMKAKGYLGRLFYSKWATLWILYVRKKEVVKTTIRKTRTHQPMGKYKATSVDKRKKTADFRLVQVSPYVIKWRTGEVEKVTSRKLEKLQKTHTWATDF